MGGCRTPEHGLACSVYLKGRSAPASPPSAHLSVLRAGDRARHRYVRRRSRTCRSAGDTTRRATTHGAGAYHPRANCSDVPTPAEVGLATRALCLCTLAAWRLAQSPTPLRLPEPSKLQAPVTRVAWIILPPTEALRIGESPPVTRARRLIALGDTTGAIRTLRDGWTRQRFKDPHVPLLVGELVATRHGKAAAGARLIAAALDVHRAHPFLDHDEVTRARAALAVARRTATRRSVR